MHSKASLVTCIVVKKDRVYCKTKQREWAIQAQKTQKRPSGFRGNACKDGVKDRSQGVNQLDVVLRLADGEDLRGDVPEPQSPAWFQLVCELLCADGQCAALSRLGL